MPPGASWSIQKALGHAPGCVGVDYSRFIKNYLPVVSLTRIGWRSINNINGINLFRFRGVPAQ